MQPEPLLEYGPVDEQLVDSAFVFRDSFSMYIDKHCNDKTFLCMQDSVYSEAATEEIPRYHQFSFLRGVKTCDEAERIGNQHFNEGTYNLIVWGLRETKDPYFDEFFYFYIRKKYNINFLSGGCVRFDLGECYGNRMAELINKKYGWTEYSNRTLEKEVREVYKKL